MILRPSYAVFRFLSGVCPCGFSNPLKILGLPMYLSTQGKFYLDEVGGLVFLSIAVAVIGRTLYVKIEQLAWGLGSLFCLATTKVPAHANSSKH
jgi:hypothetical protein